MATAHAASSIASNAPGSAPWRATGPPGADRELRGVLVPHEGNPRASGYACQVHDSYCEPAWAVAALLDAEPFSGTIRDPARGRWTIPLVFCERGLTAIGSDIIDRGFRAVGDIFDLIEPNEVHIVTDVGRRVASAASMQSSQCVS